MTWASAIRYPASMRHCLWLATLLLGIATLTAPRLAEA